MQEDKALTEPQLACYGYSGIVGQGSYGSVHLYQVKDENGTSSELPRKMAVKMIQITKNENHLKMQMREIELCKATHHKNIIRCLGIETDDRAIYIKMEVAKMNLKSFQEEIINGPVPYEGFLHFALQMAEGLAFLHEQGIVHRDIKPVNILALWPDDTQDVKNNLSCVTLKLCDFGCSRDAHTGTKTMTIVGTRSYLAPEVLEALEKQQDTPVIRVNYEKADIYSLGLVFHQLLLSKLPKTSCTDNPYQPLVIDSYEKVSISEELYSLLKLMLFLDGRERITAMCVFRMVRSWYTEALHWRNIPLEDFDPKQHEFVYKLQKQLKKQERIISKLQKQNERQEKIINEMTKQLTQNPTITINDQPVCRDDQQSPVLEQEREQEQAWNYSKPKATKSFMETDCGSSGMKALHVASRAGNLEEVSWLLDSGDVPDRPDNDGMTPLQWACERGHLSVVRVLVYRGAGLSLVAEDGWTPVNRACAHDHKSVAQLLIAAGADVNTADNKGWTPLHYVCLKENIDIMELLLQKGADANAKNNKGKTPIAIINRAGEHALINLSNACSKGLISVVKLLIERGADVNSDYSYFGRPLLCAYRNNHENIVDLLLQNGAKNV